MMVLRPALARGILRVRHAQQRREIQGRPRRRLSRPQQVAAADQLVHAPNAELRHQLAHLAGDEAQVLEHRPAQGVAVEPQLLTVGLGLGGEPGAEMGEQHQGAGVVVVPHQIDPAADSAIGTECDEGRRRR